MKYFQPYKVKMYHIRNNIDESWNHYANRKKPDQIGHTLYNTIYMQCPELSKSTETESRFMSAKGWGRGNEEWMQRGMCFFLGGNENVLKLGSADGCTTL